MTEDKTNAKIGCDTNVLEATDAMLPDTNQRREASTQTGVDTLKQWYRFTMKQLQNMTYDRAFAAFYEKYFLIGAEKIKSKGYLDDYKSLMGDYKHVLRKNRYVTERVRKRRLVLQVALLLIAINYLPLGIHNIGINELSMTANKIKFLGIGM